jgi:hypothetical protein
MLIFMYVLIFLCFLLTGWEDYLLVDGERFPCACSWCWYSHCEVHFGEDHTIEECVTCTYHQEESSQRVSTV